MKVFAKGITTIAAATAAAVATAAVVFILAINTSSMLLFVTAHAESSVSIAQSTSDDDGTSSVRVTQSTEDGLDVDCEGNLKCQIIGDDTVVATSEDDTTTSSILTSTTSGTTATTTTTAPALNQSDIIQPENARGLIGDEQDLGSAITGMVNRLLDRLL
jgi:hypothetical protein